MPRIRPVVASTEKTQRSTAGGSAAAGGFDFQSRAIAYVCAYILASQPLGWLEAEHPDIPAAVSAEREGPGDDIWVEWSAPLGGHAEAQAKRGLRDGERLREVAAGFGRALTDTPSRRGLILIDPSASRPVRHDLPQALRRMRQGRFDNQPDIATKFLGYLQAIAPTADAQLLSERLCFVDLDLEKSSSGHAQAARILLSSMLDDATQAEAAWNSLVSAGLSLCSGRGRLDSVSIRSLLSRSRIRLSATAWAGRDLASPFSRTPLSSRPLTTQLLVGRDGDLNWLECTTGDLLLVGQPGSGKTSVLHQLTATDGATFLITGDPARMASGLRSERPGIVIVDDAHVDPGRLDELVRLRRDTGIDFKIVASSWPGDARITGEKLNLADESTRTLELLTRDQVVQVVHGAGIGGPVGLVKEIVDQATGRPGLAATLVQLCLAGGVRTVAFGEAISRSIRTTFEPLVGNAAATLLAALSVGGASGMPVAEVAPLLGLSVLDANRMIARLAAGGVVLEVRAGQVAVHPPALRHSLIREEFFSGPSIIPLAALMQLAPSQGGVTESLVGARESGAAVPDNLLRALLAEHGSIHAWRDYAGLSVAEARYALEHFPGDLGDVAAPLLHWCPAEAIATFLDRAVSDERLPNQFPHHPLRVLQDWIAQAEPGTSDAVTRRKELLHAVVAWLTSGGDAVTGAKSLGFALMPRFSRSWTDPGAGMTFNYTHGVLTAEELRAVRSMWPDVVPVLRGLRSVPWQELLGIVGAWTFQCLPPDSPLPDSIATELRNGAVEFARGLAHLANGHRGVLPALRSLARRLDVDLGIVLDEYVDVLYPDEFWDEESGDWEARQAVRTERVGRLAETLSRGDPEQEIGQLVALEREMQIGGVHPNLTPYLMMEIARRAASPLTWARALFAADAEPSHLAPFVTASAERAPDDSDRNEFLIVCLASPRYRGVAIEALLGDPRVSADLVEQALPVLDGWDNAVYYLCLGCRTSEPMLRALLLHPVQPVAIAAAVGAWSAAAQHAVSPAVEREWRSAILRCDGQEHQHGHWLGEILGSDPQLAHDWLHRHRADVALLHKYGLTHPITSAVNNLDREGRWCILSSLPEKIWDDEIIAGLLGDDVELYQRLLEAPHLRYRYASGLRHLGSANWPQKAKLALQAGHSPHEIALAPYFARRSYSGDESAYWAGWIASFDRLDVNDAQLRSVRDEGCREARSRRDEALLQERHEQVFGFQ